MKYVKLFVIYVYIWLIEFSFGHIGILKIGVSPMPATTQTSIELYVGLFGVKCH